MGLTNFNLGVRVPVGSGIFARLAQSKGQSYRPHASHKHGDHQNNLAGGAQGTGDSGTQANGAKGTDLLKQQSGQSKVRVRHGQGQNADEDQTDGKQKHGKCAPQQFQGNGGSQKFNFRFSADGG